MDDENIRDRIRAVINSVPKPNGKEKIGKHLHKAVATSLEQQTNFIVVKEDTTRFLRARMPVWRDKKTCEIVPTVSQRKMDIVVYQADLPIALIEVESDLNDLQLSGVSNRNGNYDVFSIARSASGQFFHSYKSLERMAAAAAYRYLFIRDQEYPQQEIAVKHLEALKSNNPLDHNPSKLPMFLITGSCKKSEILDARLKSLDAELICKGEKCHLGGPHSRAMTI